MAWDTAHRALVLGQSLKRPGHVVLIEFQDVMQDSALYSMREVSTDTDLPCLDTGREALRSARAMLKRVEPDLSSIAIRADLNHLNNLFSLHLRPPPPPMKHTHTTSSCERKAAPAPGVEQDRRAAPVTGVAQAPKVAPAPGVAPVVIPIGAGFVVLDRPGGVRIA